MTQEDKILLEKYLPFRRNYMRVDSWHIHYIDEGEGETVILFHACPMWCFSYRKLIASLSKKYRVIAPDLPGFGLSDKPEDFDYMLNSYIFLLEEFIQNLNLSRIHIVGHGWGGTIAMGYAVQHPGMIGSITMMNSIAFSHYSLPLRMVLCRVPFVGSFLTVYTKIMESGYRKLPGEIKRCYDIPLEEPNGKEPLLRFVQTIPSVPEADTVQSILAIEAGLWMFRRTPVRIIWGQKDWLYNKKALRLWHKNLPNAEIYSLPNAGRYIQEDVPEELENLITEFLDKNSEKTQN